MNETTPRFSEGVRKKIDAGISTTEKPLVDWCALEINKALSLPEKDDREDYSNKIVKLLPPSAGWVVGSVKELDVNSKDTGKTQINRDVAEKRLKVLTSGVAQLFMNSNSESLSRLAGLGSASEIDGALPEPLKGLGERVVKKIYDDPGVLGPLMELDEQRDTLKMLGKIGKKRLSGEIEDTANQLVNLLMSKDPKIKQDQNLQEQLKMAIAYMSEELEEGVSVAPAREQGSSMVANSRRGEFDGKRFGQAEGMDRISPVLASNESLDKIDSVKDKDSGKAWVVSTLVKMSENPLFFANWWQQGVADQLTLMVSSKLGYEPFSEEYAETRDYSYAVLSGLGMQAVDRNADANSDNYGQFTPPKNMAAVLHWDDGGKNYNTLKKDATIGCLLQEIFSTAFNEKDGWKIVKAFSDGVTYDSQNKYLSDILENSNVINNLNNLGIDVSKNKETLVSKGRVAMAMFEVDWMPEWIRWANESKRQVVEDKVSKKRTTNDFSWLQAFTDEAGIDDINKATYETYAYSGKLESIIGDEKYEIGYDHPRVLRPWDVAGAIKGSYRYRPEIIWGMDNLLSPFIAKRLSSKGRWVRASGTDVGTSGVLDRYAKYGKFMSEVMGGPQAPEFDNLTTMEKIMPLAANFIGGGEANKSSDKSSEFGKFLADLFALKAEAMFFPGYKSNAKLTLSAIAGLDVMSGEMEKKKALEGAIGPSGNMAHGWVAEVNRLYGINLLAVDKKTGMAEYPQFTNAYVRVFMDTPDLDEARKTYKQAQKILNETQIAGVASGAASIFKTLFGK